MSKDNIFILLFIVLFSNYAFAQTITLKGRGAGSDTAVCENGGKCTGSAYDGKSVYNLKDYIVDDSPLVTSDKTFTGKFIAYDSQGILIFDVPFVNGRANGAGKVYYPGSGSSKYVYEITYGDGLKHGIMKWYDVDKTELMVETPYVDGKIHGIEYHYHIKNGTLHTTPYENGLRNGTIYGYQGDVITSKNTYSKGKRHGALEEYSIIDDKSVLTREGHYENGKREGPYIQYYYDGQTLLSYNCINDKIEGDYFFFYPDGSIQRQKFYKNDLQTGEEIEYYQNGGIKSVALYNDQGELHGNTVKYYEHGAVMRKQIYNKDEVTYGAYYNEKGVMITETINKKYSSIAKNYYYNGQPKSVEQYKAGIYRGRRTILTLNGKQLYYKENGELRYYLVFDYSSYVRGKCADGSDFTDKEIKALKQGNHHPTSCK